MNAKVRVHWNLHRKCWSVKRGSEPVEHMDDLVLTNAVFRVQEGGRQRVLREQRKLVHAFAVGEPSDEATIHATDLANFVQVSYNPYRAGFFYRKDTNERVDGSPMVFLLKDGRVLALIPAESAAA